MEYISALFAGLSLWVLVFNYLWTKRQQSRQQAGSLILEIQHPPRSTKKKVGLICYLLLAPSVYLLIFAFMINFNYGRHSLHYFSAFMQLFIFLQLTGQSIYHWQKVLLEIREKGIIHGLKFWPWEKIKYCRWGIYDKMLSFRVQSWNDRDLDVKIPEDQKEFVQESLGPYVEIRHSFSEVVSYPPVKKTAESSSAENIRKSGDRSFPFQYDLRTLLLFVLVVASFSSWYGVLYRRSEAIAHMARLQKKFRSLESTEYGNVVVSLDFNKCNRPLADDDLVDVRSCLQLELLHLPNASITDAGLAHLEGLTKLQYLAISGNDITDAGLVHLEKMVELRQLNISGNNISDAGLIHLEGLKKLRYLYLFQTGVTPEGVKKLQEELPNVKIHR